MNVPSPLPNRMASTLPLLPPPLLATSAIPSELKSALMTARPAFICRPDLMKRRGRIELVIPNRTMFEVPPPGLALDTLTVAVPCTAMSEAKMVAVNRALLMKVVGLALPFHLTIDPFPNPVPWIVRVKPSPPGVAVAGTSGWLIKGTAFDCAFADVAIVSTKTESRRHDFMTLLLTPKSLENPWKKAPRGRNLL